METETKPFWQSKTFWGFFFAAALPLLASIGVELPVGSEDLSDIMTNFLSAGFALFGIIGHAVSKKKMTLSLT